MKINISLRQNITKSKYILKHIIENEIIIN